MPRNLRKNCSHILYLCNWRSSLGCMASPYTHLLIFRKLYNTAHSDAALHHLESFPCMNIFIYYHIVPFYQSLAQTIPLCLLGLCTSVSRSNASSYTRHLLRPPVVAATQAEMPSLSVSSLTCWHSLILHGSPVRRAWSMTFIYIFAVFQKQTGPPMELIQRLRHQIRRKWGLIADAPAAATPSLKLQAVRARSLSALSHLAAERDWGSKFYFFYLFFCTFQHVVQQRRQWPIQVAAILCCVLVSNLNEWRWR